MISQNVLVIISLRSTIRRLEDKRFKYKICIKMCNNEDRNLLVAVWKQKGWKLYCNTGVRFLLIHKCIMDMWVIISWCWWQNGFGKKMLMVTKGRGLPSANISLGTPTLSKLNHLWVFINMVDFVLQKIQRKTRIVFLHLILVKRPRNDRNHLSELHFVLQGTSVQWSRCDSILGRNSNTIQYMSRI